VGLFTVCANSDHAAVRCILALRDFAADASLRIRRADLHHEPRPRDFVLLGRTLGADRRRSAGRWFGRAKRFVVLLRFPLRGSVVTAGERR
jgi:hypothetical protein